MKNIFALLINNQEQKLGFAKKRLEELGKRTMKRVGVTTPIECSLAIVKPSSMQRFNSMYRKQNKPTDVLSFDFGVMNGIRYCEIVLCPQIIRKTAIMFSHSFRDHTAYLFVHGLLHALGYDHARTKEAQIMEKLERSIVNQKIARS